MNSNYKERRTQYSQLANRLKMTKTSLSLGSVLEVPGAWGLFGDVWRCLEVCSLKHFEVFDLLVVSKIVMNCPAQARRSCWNLVLAWQSSDRPAAPARYNRCTHRSRWFGLHLNYVWILGLCLLHLHHITCPTSTSGEVCHKTKFLAVSRIRLRLFQFASSAWLLHSAAYVELFVSICIYSSDTILAFGNRAGR